MCFLSLFFIIIPAIRFGIASRTLTTIVPIITIPNSIVMIAIVIIASPSCWRANSIVAMTMIISSMSASPFEIGGSPAVFSIASSSVSWNIRFIIFPAILAIMNPMIRITIIERKFPR